MQRLASKPLVSLLTTLVGVLVIMTPVFAGGAVAQRVLPPEFCSGEPLQISISLEFPTETVAAGVQEDLPEDWVVGSISHGGVYDEITHSVKWLFFFSPFPTEVSYEGTPGEEAVAPSCFDGKVSVNGNDEPIGGEICLPRKLFGDADRNGSVTLFDLFCVMDGFSDTFEDCLFEDVDLEPCGGNGAINLSDFFAIIEAFNDVDPCCGG